VLHLVVQLLALVWVVVDPLYLDQHRLQVELDLLVGF
jgi:hypothetical protein